MTYRNYGISEERDTHDKTIAKAAPNQHPAVVGRRLLTSGQKAGNAREDSGFIFHRGHGAAA